MIDTHAHIYLSDFDGDRDLVIEKANKNGINRILMPAIDSSTHASMLEVEKKFDNCLSMIGLHPCSVTENFAVELSIVKDFLKERNFVAVGEIGIDLYWDKSAANFQHQAFHEQIGLAMSYQLPVVIHSRNAIEECIEVVRQYPGLKGVFHCFSGTLLQAQRIIDLGLMLGIGGVLTFKNAGLDAVIRELGIANVVLETDAPYLAPIPFRGKRNEPAHTKLVAEKLSSITNVPVEEVEELTTRNAVKLFKL